VLDAAVSALNNVLRSSGSSLQFSVDRETDIGVVTVVDSNTGEVIRQIPSEEAIAIARSIDAFLAQSDASCGPGLLCKQVA
jgi:flagellar protein FlaG